MANPQIATFQMTKTGDTYSFQYEDGYYIENIAGTPKEIAYLIFDKLVIPRTSSFQDGYGYSWHTNSWPPFWVDESGVIQLDFLSKIEPEPNQEFWNELNRQFQRFMKLLVFS